MVQTNVLIKSLIKFNDKYLYTNQVYNCWYFNLILLFYNFMLITCCCCCWEWEKRIKIDKISIFRVKWEKKVFGDNIIFDSIRDIIDKREEKVNGKSLTLTVSLARGWFHVYLLGTFCLWWWCCQNMEILLF